MGMQVVSIREAAEEDVAAVLDLYRAAGIGGEDNFTVEEGIAHFAALKRASSLRLFVAVIDGSIVGTYELMVMDNMAKAGKRSGVVEDVAVSPDHQGQGVGRAMMVHALEECRKSGCYKLMLSSNLKREEAHRFYEALGFKRHGYSFQVEVSG